MGSASDASVIAVNGRLPQATLEDAHKQIGEGRSAAATGGLVRLLGAHLLLGEDWLKPDSSGKTS
jgi:hypothetical protein